MKYYYPFDVCSLCTNIPHDFGYEAMKYWLNKYPNAVIQRLDKDFILEGVTCIMGNTTFHFDNKYFMQKRGTAMGTKIAPTHATLTWDIQKRFYYIQKLLKSW